MQDLFFLRMIFGYYNFFFAATMKLTIKKTVITITTQRSTKNQKSKKIINKKVKIDPAIQITSITNTQMHF